MLLAVSLAALWIACATVIGLSPRKYHWRGGVVLLAVLIVLLPYLWIAGHPFFAIMFAIGVGSILRWPFYYLGKSFWMKITGGPFHGPNSDT